MCLGHTDLILGVDSAQWDSGLLASCSKDNSCLLWRVTKGGSNGMSVERIGIATGHTNSVLDVTFSRHRTTPFMLTASNDSTLKLWNLQQLLTKNEEDMEEK